MNYVDPQRKALEYLRDARNLLGDKDRWTQGVWARDRFGKQTDPLAENATCWCALGMLRRVAKMTAMCPKWPQEFAIARDQLLTASREKYQKNITNVNDDKRPDRAYHDTLSVYDRAIANLKRSLK